MQQYTYGVSHHASSNTSKEDNSTTLSNSNLAVRGTTNCIESNYNEQVPVHQIHCIMKTIAISIRKAAIAKAGETNKLIVIGTEGTLAGAIRGLSEGRVHQLLKTVDVVIDKKHGAGMLVPLVLLNGLKLNADVAPVRKGDKFSYTAEQLKAIGEITARPTPEAEPEVVVAGKEYVAMHDGFRLISMDNIELIVPADTAMNIAKAGKFFNGDAVAVAAEDVATEEMQ